MSYTVIARLLFVLTPMLPCAVLATEPPTASDADVTIRAEPVIPAKPIVTRAQLDAYLHDTPAASSPLSWLTPGAQRRFLDSMVFGEHGLGGMSLDDLSYELTREQAYDLLRLFGAQSYAIDLDARSTPRPAGDDKQVSTLESRYDQLIAAADQGDDNATHTQNLKHIYTEQFAPFQTDAQRHVLSDRDVEFLFRAATTLAFRITSQPDYLADMRSDFAELAHRHRIDRPHAGNLYNALITAHHVDEARALRAAYPLVERSPAPVMRSSTRIRDGQPSLWIVTPGARKRELVRFRFNIRTPAQVVVLASTGCHFSQNAARDIEADLQLREVFRDYAQWVAPASEVTAFDAVQAWNQAHPTLRLGIAYDDATLPMVERFDTPTFYFLSHGRIIDKVIGWPEGGNLEAIRRGLRKIDLMR
ncbi:hypothetical protein GCM10008098_22890 [Rhodanobacter panaciterrae]|uniref:Uncharacterized protein n=1 Tax=Rhodanobacter panaciterrae TaxID=490572 RepID=A0ABQ2ZXW5_9GAMM|nr:hypothetical protein [Rhodanobacter panaciterrae]GGY29060.1 hypothetical protein GCM10008098_22890 [Rhodanobacter panaciterrae]